MGYPIQHIAKIEADPQRRAADRALLLTRIAVGLAHDGKNPLHNMVLHLQLMMAEKLGSAPVEKHLAAMREGIGRVDSLLKAFGEFAAPDYQPPDLAAAAQRAVQLFAHDARRASVQVSLKAPAALLVQPESMLLGDLVAHALVACIESAHGGQVDLLVEPRGAVAVLEARAAGGSESREHALPHFDAARRLAADAACELSITAPTEGGARLSLSFLHPR